MPETIKSNIVIDKSFTLSDEAKERIRIPIPNKPLVDLAEALRNYSEIVRSSSAAQLVAFMKKNATS